MPPVNAITLICHYVDGSSDDWHFSTSAEARTFMHSAQAAKAGFGEDWMADIFRIDVRAFSHGAN